ncbi:Heavy metal transport/detoxification superfamily protein [Perilla frutescens var. hirtella]|uniref:Heavy metal transport/detoxification superfamily protein n=1 Tax=Perilla frutescens var. hirtella TaxID=608512 RepID=A0AAD4JEV6_PERFH|nr:Heavy metal transport/detoxification superfamily protein [Perilla frutescens var. hirtella]KAH6802176.1 Heavy metal transport/detoxification superfamily protein [Perilla frutescens var. frutescens]KAH6805579.1 Heavy metal transport/detoxification superfamily protein [Perilla frutescens var. frutescens]KAH6832131.1 Heavy metal transport/detoxification superfamily protein [Perilla frutescens var. hirtella]
MGIIDHISDLFTVSSTRKSKRKPMQTVDVKVKMDCEGCERRVRNAVSSMKGARSVEVDRKQSHVAVTGYLDAKKVLKRIRRTGKKPELWPYVEYNLTYYPYAPGAYDKKAPSGYVRDVYQAYPSTTEEKYATFFSDDNVNACSIM